ncbi:RagB/SusD family nutrient uptake outer membrane protein [Sphingobacterium sp. Mn56C]|uniref:RagB/SusD family nutrient uptake outer membrane protein n=1 Tax=Sphingobacterium sp. Mn56C TaxID=3395261 RepID=UPI003BD0DC2D
MKKNIFIGLLAGALFLTSCDKFLDVNPESKIPAKDIFQNKQNLNAYVLDLYRSWRDSHKDRVNMYLGTDESNLGGIQWRDDYSRRGMDTYTDGLNSTNGNVQGIWKSRFEVAQRAAAAIAILSPGQGTNEAEFNIRLGELSLLRAINHFELVQMFGAIPLADDLKKAEYGSRRQPIEEVYKHIENDLILASKYLLEPGNGDNKDPRRATKALAQAMLGKLYLYAPQNSGIRSYEKAAEQFKLVVDNPYFGRTGATDFKTIFDADKESTDDYKREMIYAFQFNNVGGDINSIQFAMGSRVVSNATKPESLIPFAGFDNIVPTEYAYKDKKDGGIWEDGDVRKNESIRYDFAWEGVTPPLSGYVWGDELDPHVKKYEDARILKEKQSTYYSGKNVPFIRFSDIVLNYAECLYFTGKQAEAIDLINNVVRKRAFGGTLPADKRWSSGMGQQEFMKNLMDERMRELCFEGWRKFDLIRTGLLKDYVSTRNRWVLGTYKGKPIEGAAKVKIDEFRFIWPIPLDELRQNPDLTLADQNPGY